MKLNKVFLLRFFVGALFIFSGIVKLFPVEAFAFQILDRGIHEKEYALFLANLLIGTEIFLGAGLLQKSYLRKFYVPASLLMLFIYSLDLTRTIFIYGFSGNCGCFGQYIDMTPLEALIKNFALIVSLIFIYKNLPAENSKNIRVQLVVFLTIFIFVFSISYRKHLIINYNANSAPEILQQKIYNDSIKVAAEHLENNLNDSNSLAENIKVSGEQHQSLINSLFKFKEFKGDSNVDFSQGEKVAAFLNPDCESCINVAVLLRSVKNEIELPKVYYFFMGNQSEVAGFLKRTKTENPYILLDDLTFFNFIEKHPPRIILFRNGKIAGDWNDSDFNSYNLKKALRNK